MNTLHHQIYNKLIQLAPDLQSLDTGDAMKSIGTGGLMDLNLDVLEKEKEHTIIALSHYYRHESGDMIPDPDMEIRIFTTLKIAEAMTYQDIFRYDEVYENNQCVDPQLKKSLNDFLHSWLNNCLEQKHKLERKTD